MNTEINKCRRIKKLIEDSSGIEDIGKRCRSGHYPELKKMYTHLCLKYTKCTLREIGDILGGYRHSNMIHMSRSFADILEVNQMNLPNVYYQVMERLEFESKFLSYEKIPASIHEVDQNHRTNLIKIIDKGHNVISKQRREIDVLKSILLKYVEPNRISLELQRSA